MTGAGDVSIKVESSKVQFFDGVEQLARFGLIPEGMYHNRDYIQDKVTFEDEIPLEIQDLLFDPQTSGGLILSLSDAEAKTYIERMKGDAFIIGKVMEKGITPIVVVR
jgi:selenide,water dikinase